MTQEEKEMLIKDLCGRLPYGVECEIRQREGCSPVLCDKLTCDPLKGIIEHGWYVQPYLRPMSSMTEEEREDFWWNVLDMDWREDLDVDEEMEIVPFPFVENGYGFYLDNFYLQNFFAVIDWLNAHHFDYRGLIPKGLALEATEGMYNN